jgi:hypothetical protein
MIQIYYSSKDPDPERIVQFLELSICDWSMSYFMYLPIATLWSQKLPTLYFSWSCWRKNSDGLKQFKRYKKIYFSSVFRIRDILIRMRILGSGHLSYGSGSGSCPFRPWLPRCKQKQVSFFENLFSLLLSVGRYIYINLQRLKRHEEVTKQQKSRLFSFFVDGRIRIRTK